METPRLFKLMVTSIMPKRELSRKRAQFYINKEVHHGSVSLYPGDEVQQANRRQWVVDVSWTGEEGY